MVPIGKKPAPGDHESSLKIFLEKLFLARCPCAGYIIYVGSECGIVSSKVKRETLIAEWHSII